MSLLDDVSIVVTPNGYKAGTLFGAIPVPTEGSNVVVNGDFTTDSDWTKGTGWTISGGTANCDGTQTGTTSLTPALNNVVNNVTYIVEYTISNYTSGSISIKLGNTGYGVVRSANGTYTEEIKALATTFPRSQINADASFVGSIDNVSVKEYTSADMDVTRATAATRVDENGLVNYAESIGSELVTNGDFELNSDWNNFSTPTTSEQSTEQSHTGTYSWKVIADATQEGIFSPNNFSITNGNSYSVSLWIYSVSGNSIKSGLNNTNVSVFTERTVIAGQWTNITYEATATSTGASYISILSQNSLNFYVDDVSVKEVARDNVPRIDYTGGGCPHILAEPQRTNLIARSIDFSTAYWSQQAGIIPTYNTTETLSPDGTYNSTKFVGDGTTGVFKGSLSISGTAARTVYLKSVTGTTTATLKDPNATGGATPVNITITNEWQRFELIGDNGTSNQGIWIDDITSDGLYMWGVQVEVGSYATSYIPTSGSTVTRNQDQFTRDGIGSLINSTEGVLFVEMAALSDDGVDRFITLSDGGLRINAIRIYYFNTGGFIFFQKYVGGTRTTNMSTTSYTQTSFNKLAIRYNSTTVDVWANGVKILTNADTNAITSGTLNSLKLSQGDGTNPFYGKVKQLQVYKTALTDTQLAALTS